MAAGIPRWSQIVRTPGAVEVYWHQQSEIPALGTDVPSDVSFPSTRLFVRSLGETQPLTTIDVVSSATRAMLEGFLATGIHVRHRIGWRAKGYGKLRRDTLSIRPLKPGE